MGAAVARLVGRASARRSVWPVIRLAAIVAVQAAVQAQPGAIERMVLFEPVFFRALQLTGDDAALDPAAAHFEDYARRATAGEPEVVRLMIDYWFGDGAFARMPDPVRGYLDAMRGAQRARRAQQLPRHQHGRASSRRSHRRFTIDRRRHQPGNRAGDRAAAC